MISDGTHIFRRLGGNLSRKRHEKAASRKGAKLAKKNKPGVLNPGLKLLGVLGVLSELKP